MYTHLVLGGGGIKGCVITGALEAINKLININRIQYVIGSSVGGIIGLLFILGFTPKEMTNIFLNINLSEYREIKVTDIISDYGVDDGKKIIRLIKAIILQKYNICEFTFNDLYKETGKTLILTASDISNSKSIYLSRITKPNMKVLDAIRITISYPILYKPCIIDNNYYIDGAALDDYPINYFKNIKRKIGISLETDISNFDKLHEITNILNYSSAIIFSILKKYNALKKNKFKESTIIIKLPKIHALDYGITYNTKKMLRNIGYKTSYKFIINTIDKFRSNRIKKNIFNILKKYKYTKN